MRSVHVLLSSHPHEIPAHATAGFDLKAREIAKDVAIDGIKPASIVIRIAFESAVHPWVVDSNLAISSSKIMNEAMNS